uniref:dynein axonemal heavy chain 8 n=1 Tax=Myxine glutinosa TaxID=7769 RepID=UPI00358ECCF5
MLMYDLMIPSSVNTENKALQLDIVNTTKEIQKLVNQIKMIHDFSRHYNTSERISTLFMKVTNQMVTASKDYITDSGSNGVWEQSVPLLIKKMQVCTNLFKAYKDAVQCFKKLKGEKALQMSETEIFGKFQAFCARLEKIEELLGRFESFTSLAASTIEGIDSLATKFQKICLAVQKRPYDILDPETTAFDRDFKEFTLQIHSLEIQLQEFMKSFFVKIISTSQAMHLLQRFENLNMPCILPEVIRVAERILQHYFCEVKIIKKTYENEKHDPSRQRDITPIAGRILWARNLIMHLQDPIRQFQKMPLVLSSDIGKKALTMCKNTVHVLQCYVDSHHNEWTKIFQVISFALQATLLVRHPQTGKLLVNFDLQICEKIQETKYFLKMGLEVPQKAMSLLKVERELKMTRSSLKDLLKNYEEIHQRSFPMFSNLMAFHVKKVDDVLRQGLTLITWSSLNIDVFFHNATIKMSKLYQLQKKINDRLEVRIDEVLQDISSTFLVQLPVADSWTVEEFLSKNETHTKECAKKLDMKCNNIEKAVNDIIFSLSPHPGNDVPWLQPKTEECELCVLYDKHVHDNEDTSKCTQCTAWKEHNENARRSRKAYREDSEKELGDKDAFFSVDMQKVIMLPRLPGVKTCVFTRRLVLFHETFAPLGGKQAGRNRQPIGVVWHEGIACRQAEDVVSAYDKLIHDRAYRDCENFTFWVDNCSAQNKNWVLFTGMVLMVNEDGGPNTVTLNYFEKGHTFMSADAFHAQIERGMRSKKNIYDFADFVEVVDNSGAASQMGPADFSLWENGMSSAGFTDKPVLRTVHVAQFRRGSSKIYWKTSIEDDDFSCGEFLKKKVAEKLLKGQRFPSRNSARGIPSNKKDDILKKLCPLMPPNRCQFWRDIAENQASQDLIAMKATKKHVKFVVNDVEEQGPEVAKETTSDTEAVDFIQEREKLVKYYHQKILNAVFKALRISLDALKERIFISGVTHQKKRKFDDLRDKEERNALIKTEAHLSIHNIVLTPSIDDIQLATNKIVHMIMGVSQGVAYKSQQRCAWLANKHEEGMRKSALKDDKLVEEGAPKLKMHNLLDDNKDLGGQILLLSCSIDSYCKPVLEALENLGCFQEFWKEDSARKIEAFMAGKPSLSEFKAKIFYYDDFKNSIQEMKTSLFVGPIEIITEPLKFKLSVEAMAWKMLYCRHLHANYKNLMDNFITFNNEQQKSLSRSIQHLDDVRFAMATIHHIHEKEIDFDMSFGPTEEAYAILNHFEFQVTKEERESVDTLQYSFAKLLSKTKSVQDELVKMQPEFKYALQDSVDKFKKEVVSFSQYYKMEGPMVQGITPSEASNKLEICQGILDNLWSKFTAYSSNEELFGLPVNKYADLERMKTEMGLLQKLYGLYNSVMTSINGYFDVLWTNMDIEKINAELLDFQNRCRKLPKALKEWQAFLDLKKKIDDFSESCPLLNMMTHKAMKPLHWDRIAEVTKHPFDMLSETFCLRNVMEAPLLKHKEDIEDICISAVKEKDIEAKFLQVTEIWSNQNFTFSAFKTRGELLLKNADVAEIVVTMEDSLMILSSLLSNRYNAPFKKNIQKWVLDLSNTSDIIDKLMFVQNLWIYLEAVFVGGDIAKQLPQEAKRFHIIDKSWVRIMQKAHKIPNVLQCCVEDESLGHFLPYMQEQLEICQKSLTGYLEKKRLLFPRFFFVSDPTLLQILGQASDSHTIQAHLLGIFDNINEVEFDVQDYDKMLAVISREGEKVNLDPPVMAKGNVELWLGELLTTQQSSLHSIIKSAYLDINDTTFELLSFFAQYPAQVGLLGLQMLWTRDAEDALSYALKNRRIMSLTNQKFLNLLNTLIRQTTYDLTKFERVKFETLITIHLHQRDIFNDLVRMHIKAVSDFEWLKQSRFYFKENLNQCIVSITDVDFIYQNEFLGCTDRLVITPLTDRCYITLSQALGMSMGGAPAGPAGTGKTETTKDMGRCLGKYVVVFNCSDQMDFRSLGRIYKGLAQSGSWGCFDEFNRIDLCVLSVAAQQIHIVLSAKKEKKTQFIFSDGDCVTLNPEFGIFLTMNPGYAGRQELPENLKIQFRTVSMMVPDRQIIMRVKLASCGFLENVILAQKFYVLYKLCEEQLTKQVHYDFGLRNILTVLRALGSQKRARPNDSESTIVMRVLRDMNLSKLVDEDEPLFLSLINDLFPSMQLEKSTYKGLQAAVTNQIKLAGLVNHPPWNLKLVQLYETAKVRHGLMMLGPSGSGKTAVIRTLMKAMTEIGSPHREMRMNPKAITAPQMFGRLDSATNDWTDGIFSTLWRKTLKSKKGENVWIVLDGPVDALWIENLNSVLDDNKTLTLANGDRITMSPNCKLLFEVHNIDNASPATVSRMGMVYISSSALSWRPILMAWLKRRNLKEAEILLSLYDDVFEEAYTYMSHTLHPKMQLLECNYITQSTDILTGLLPKQNDRTNLEASHIQRLFIFALMWSLGALLERDDRTKLERFLRTYKKKLDLPSIPSESQDTIFEFLVNQNGNWEHWNSRIEEYVYPSDFVPAYSSILVPNVDNVRTNFLIGTISEQSKAVLLIGEQGTGKTVMMKAYMAKYNPEAHLSKSFNFSSASEPMMFQRTIESFVNKRIGTTYGPADGRRMTVFIDDINMPFINAWGDQITNEIVRQMMEMHGMYSLDKPGEFLTIEDVQFVAAMIHPGGGRNDIPQRLKRQFCTFNSTLPSNASIDKIFGIIGCGYFDPCRGFNPDMKNLVMKLVSATRILWQWTKVKMLPTPSNFHYIFNLRDLSRIWQGMLAIKANECQSNAVLLALFKHECFRVIADRFTSVEDRNWFEKSVTRVVQEQVDPELVQLLHPEPYFVDFLRDAPEPTGEEADDACLEAPKIYELIPSYEELAAKLKQYQVMHNELVHGTDLDLVFFTDAMTHLIKISRIIRTSPGNALLVGVGGSGKQSLTRLASFIAGNEIFQIVLTRFYNNTNLMDDLKLLYRIAGGDGKGVTFVFTDNEIKEEGFLEYINNMLSLGEISNLFPRDELDEICQNLIPVMKKELPRQPPTQDNLYDYFISRAKKNLHVVLCFSPVGEKFRSRALKFPGLISGCTVDWFSRWPREALVAVANHFLSNFFIVCSPDTKLQLIETTAEFHDKVFQTCEQYFQRYRRRTHVTPKSYLAFINSYKSVYKEKYSQINDQADRMIVGLNKILEASESISQLANDLAEKKEGIAVASVKTDKVLEEVKVSALAAEKVKDFVSVKKEKSEGLVDAVAREQAVAKGKLQAAEPALELANQALQTIKPADISTVRKLAKPPHMITLIMDCVLILFQNVIEPTTMDPGRPFLKTSWEEALKVMSGGAFLQSLQTFSKDSINAETVDLLGPYMQRADYTLEEAKKVCSNVAGLLLWTRAMVTYYGINEEVLPLQANLLIQQNRLDKAQVELDEVQRMYDDKQAEVDSMMAELDAAKKEKQDLLDVAATCQKRMQTSSVLIDGLSGEKVRWTQQSKVLKEQIERLVGDVLLATGFLSYCGPFNQAFRNVLLKDIWEQELKKRRIPFTDDIGLIAMLTDQPTISEWNLQGLPNDDLSTQNAIIVVKASRYPLLIDPQTQGKNWIKKKEEANNLQVTALNHKNFRTHLENCLTLGQPLLIEDVREELDPALDNVLEKNLIKLGSIFKVKVGDKEVDVIEGFRLYITTKLPNPEYTPEISAKTSIIDFTVTLRGLEDQLLGRVILNEKQELESDRVMLIEDVTANKRKMKQLEDNLLFKLSSTKGSLVDDDSLIGVLKTTKVTSSEVTRKLNVAAKTEIKINEAREEFRPVATRGSTLYFLITEMNMVNVMYQTSLAQFLKLFDSSMCKSENSTHPTKRILNIIEFLTYEVFSYTVRGLYETHKFLFTLLLALKIDMQQGNIKHNEFEVFIKGGAALDLKACTPKPFRWILDMTWLNLVEICKLPHFGKILNQVTRNDKNWKAWFETDAPEEESIPDGYSDSLDTFRKLILIRSWCPDRTLFQAHKYIANSLGEKYAEPVILNLLKTWEESNTKTPLICFLSMGSDPTTQIQALAKRLSLACKAISMGQGQEVHARRLLQSSMEEGGWVLLQNCHLGLEFMDELFNTISTSDTPHKNFRVWITTEAHPKFSITLLQSSIKFTNEPPQGMKAGLKRTFAGISQDHLEVNNLPVWKPMLYALAFLHTTVQERRKFGPLGWNIPYEFNSADFTASMQFMINHLDECGYKKNVSWVTIHYMLGEVQYGGRVTDDYDRRLLNCLTRVWFGEKMLDPSFHFFTGYKIPACKTIVQYIDYIQTLPMVDSPEVFGLHQNADITYQSNTASEMLNTIMNIQPKDSGGGDGESRESQVYNQAHTMLEKLPPSYIPHQVKARLQKMGPLNSMSIFLRQEIDRMQKVISLVYTSLSDLKLAIDGTIIMSENLRDALDNIYDARVPSLWRKISWESSNLGFWFTDLLDRNAQFYTWIFSGRPNAFWMAGFFNPQGFLTAMRQEVTRAHEGWALDSVTLHNEVLKHLKEDINSSPKEGVYVYGLYLDGSAWDRRNCRLTESIPKVLFAQLPVVHIYAINSTAPKDPRLYVCPVYKKPCRTDLTYITAIYLHTAQSPDHWTLRGVALLGDIK